MLRFNLFQMIFVMLTVIAYVRGYEVIKASRGYELHVNEDYHRVKRSDIKVTDGLKKNEKEIVFISKTWNLTVKIYLNEYLFAPYYEFFDSNSKRNKSDLRHCYYHGKVVGEVDSLVSISNCNGAYHGTILVDYLTRFSIHTRANMEEVIFKPEISVYEKTLKPFYFNHPSKEYAPILRNNFDLGNQRNSNEKENSRTSTEASLDQWVQQAIEHNFSVPLKKRSQVEPNQRDDGAENYFDLMLGLNYREGITESHAEQLIADYANLLQYFYRLIDFNSKFVRLSGAHFLNKKTLGGSHLHTTSKSNEQVQSALDIVLKNWLTHVQNNPYLVENSDFSYVLTLETLPAQTDGVGTEKNYERNCVPLKTGSVGMIISNAPHNHYEQVRTMAHEIGHNVGIPHACTPLYPNCSEEYSHMNATATEFQQWRKFSILSLMQMKCTPASFRKNRN